MARQVTALENGVSPTTLHSRAVTLHVTRGGVLEHAGLGDGGLEDDGLEDGGLEDGVLKASILDCTVLRIILLWDRLGEVDTTARWQSDDVGRIRGCSQGHHVDDGGGCACCCIRR